MATTAPSSQATTVTGMDLVCVVARDVSRTVAFYRDILGITPTLDEPGGAEFELSDGSTLGVWNPGAGEEVQPRVVVMFAVPDAKATVAAIRTRGGTISDVDETPVCFMAFGKDPDDVQYIIHQRKTK
jgi:predicted enzyme related to lactoylglutathione lyase